MAQVTFPIPALLLCWVLHDKACLGGDMVLLDLWLLLAPSSLRQGGHRFLGFLQSHLCLELDVKLLLTA